ncbi:hypothetical protein CMUS01_03112 [Colletotrichum musicola]|uniref:Uncharacterized protein n=1 Tax=Colletotrichum musicola TaxID=2175873 RepID=A0A8H6NTR8_9PEZI|nr:hypothetical protein CMUS01_03112 [Colletotrichum musicola]
MEVISFAGGCKGPVIDILTLLRCECLWGAGADAGATPYAAKTASGLCGDWDQETRPPPHRTRGGGVRPGARAHDTSLSPWGRWEKVVLGERHCCDDSDHNPATSRDRMLVVVVFGQFAVKTAIPSTEPQERRNLCYSAYP